MSSYDKRRDTFVARPTINGKRVYLGQFHTREEADYVTQLRLSSLNSQFDTTTCDEFGKPSLYSRIRNFFMSKRP